jgi:hypothetical protein
MKLFPRKKRRPASLSRQEALQCIPVQNSSAIHSTELESGEIRLEYPLPISPFFRSIYKRFQNNADLPTKKLQLDEMGSAVWMRINGEDSAQTIVSYFADHYGITLHEAEISVTTFLAELGKRGLIAMR